MNDIRLEDDNFAPLMKSHEIEYQPTHFGLLWYRLREELNRCKKWMNLIFKVYFLGKELFVENLGWNEEIRERK